MPPEWVSLYMLQKPSNGGDTLFASTVGAYERLSPSQQKLVDSLEVVNRCQTSHRKFHQLLLFLQTYLLGFREFGLSCHH